MELIAKHGDEDIAIVYVARNRNSNRYLTEFAESRERSHPIEKKLVILVSSLYGCPVGCLMCDAPSQYNGRLTKEEILEQIDYIIKRRFCKISNKEISNKGKKNSKNSSGNIISEISRISDGMNSLSDGISSLSNGMGSIVSSAGSPISEICCDKLKIQFSRIGEPSFNPAVLDVLRELPLRYNAPGLICCISTIAPSGCENFLEELIRIKNKLYFKGRFQLQFSIHTTDEEKRDRLIPIKKWGLSQIADYGERFFEDGDRKITLNFAGAKEYPINPKIIRETFNSDKFILKFTPLNPTIKVRTNNLKSLIDPCSQNPEEPLVGLFKEFNSYGFETILSIGSLEENSIGSNCGQILNSVKELKGM